jgi:hypothetical protein
MSPNPGRITGLTDLDPEDLQRWLERAAICEVDGLLPQADAERIAWECVLIARHARHRELSAFTARG